MFQKKTFFNIIRSRFFIVLASKNEASITIFSDMFRKRRFCEHSQKSLNKQWFLLIFQGRSPQKSTKNRCQNAFEQKHRKKLTNNRFRRPCLAPKTSENRSKIMKNRFAERCKTRPFSRRYGPHAGVGGRQRKSSFVKRPNGYAYD